MTDLHTRAVTLADADGTAPDVAEMIHDLLDALKAAPLSAAAAYEKAAALMEIAAENCKAGFTYPPKTQEHRDYQTGAIAHFHAAKAIRALPQPTDAELDAAALARPVVRALVDAAKRLAEWAEQLRACGDAGNWEWTAGDEYSETIAALSAAKGAADADR